MLSHQVIPSLPLSRTIRDLPRSPNQPFVFIPTLSRHANPLWESPVYGAAITYGKPVPIEASNFPKWAEGCRLAYPTTGSLLLRAKDRLRLFRKLLEKGFIKDQFLWSSFLFERKVAGKQHRRDFNPLAGGVEFGMKVGHLDRPLCY